MMTEREEKLAAMTLDMLSAMQKRSMAISEFLSFPGEGGGDVINLGVSVEETYTKMFEALGLPEDNYVSEQMLIFDFLAGKMKKQKLIDHINSAMDAQNGPKSIQNIMKERRLNIQRLTSEINRISEEQYGTKIGSKTTIHRILIGERPLTKSFEIDVFARVFGLSHGDLKEAIHQ